MNAPPPGCKCLSIPAERCTMHAGNDHPERVRELTETGHSVRYTGRPIMTMIAEALGPDEPERGE